MIPTDKQDAVKRSLQKAFGVTFYESIEPLTNGLSGALVYKITVHRQPYVLRIINRTMARDNPVYYFECMQAAADTGLAPKIHHLSIEDGISITDFIQDQPFAVSSAREKMAGILRQLHALPKFSRQLNYLDAADNFLQKFRASNIVPENPITNDLFESYARIAKVYPRNDTENLVSSHNDIKPDNIIFDGTKPWLIDWEAARLNDRYLDLAAVGNFVIKNDKDEAVFLTQYFGEAANEYKQSRFFLMSNITHLFCFVLCSMAAAAGNPINIEMSTPGFNEFHDGLWDKKISLVNNHEKLQYGLAHLQEFRRKTHTRRFEESIRIVAGYSNAAE